MKTLKKLLMSGLAITFVLTSCTIEKRIYMSGYHIDWFRSKHIPDKIEITSNYDLSKSVNKKSIKARQSYEDKSALQVGSEDSLVFTADISPVVLPINKSASYIRYVNTQEVKKSPKKFELTDQTQASSKQLAIASKQNASTVPENTGKSQLVALLLCIFVGALGIHRFYLGYTGIGIIQLLTFGGCGIWSLIDLILIVTGDLKPKDGEYEKKL